MATLLGEEEWDWPEFRCYILMTSLVYPSSASHAIARPGPPQDGVYPPESAKKNVALRALFW
jgi:hypothetical protein